MRIERLHIDGFGYYHDREIGPLDGSITVINGPNEAGKSTLLAFVRAVLFGFPSRLGAQHYPPLRGGLHGGRLELRLDDGRRYVAERIRGRGRGAFQARGEDGEALDEGAFAPLIGRASETLFRSAFTFDLDDLPAFDATDGNLGGLLYGVSIGAEQLPQTLDRLDQRIDALFLPGGSNQQVARLLKELDGTEAHLREVMGQADEYRRLSARREEIGRDVAEARGRIAERDRRHQERERRRRAWDDWARRRVLNEQLAGLEEMGSFPEGGVGRLERVEEEVREAEAALVEADRDCEEARRGAERPVRDAGLLESADAIEGLRRGRDAVDGSLRDLPQRQAELDGREEDLQRLLAELGPGWDEERLWAFDLSIPRRDHIAQWQGRFEEISGVRHDYELALDDARRVRDNAAEALGEAERQHEEQGDAPVRAAVEERRSLLRQARARLVEYERGGQRVELLEAQQRGATSSVEPRLASLGGRGVLAALVILAVALGLGAIGALVEDQGTVALVLGFLAVAALSVAGVVAGVAVRGREPAAVAPGRQRLDRWLEEARVVRAAAAEGLRRQAVDIAVDSPAGRLPDAAALDAVETELERDRDRAEERRRAEERVAVVKRQLDRAGRRFEEAGQAAETTRSVVDEVRAEWGRWLKGEALPPDLAPQTASDLVTRVEVARGKAEELRQWRRRVEAIRADIQQYGARVEPVARPLGLDTAFADHGAVVGTADAIIARFEAARTEQGSREQARIAVEERERTCEGVERQLAEARRRLAALLEAGGAASGEEFRRRSAAHAKRRELERDRDECELRLRQVSGPEPELLEALDRALQGTSREQIEADLEALDHEVEAAQQQRDALLNERGRVERGIEELYDDVAASEARSRRAVLESELQAVVSEWSSLVAARALLRRTRERYERERQPAVIQRAAESFATLTGGRYTRLYQPIGESTVTVEDRDGSQKLPAQLSRATREQLYLALRFGAIEEAARSHERLPVIVDEVLVNFDPVRARLAAQGFARLAEHTQVIVFTCHPWVAGLFGDVAREAQVIELD